MAMTNSGLLTIYSLENIQEKGRMPVDKLVEVGKAFYSELVIGYGRRYAALGASQQIDALVRCHNTEIPENGKYVILEDGLQYRIDFKQKIIEKDAIDLTLVRLEENYDVYAGDTQEILQTVSGSPC